MSLSIFQISRTGRLLIGAAVLFAGQLFATSCHAIEIPESVIAKAVDEKFPISKGEFEIIQPKISLLAEKAVFCATAKPKLFKSGIDFCASFVPKWRKETGTLHLSNMSITSIKVPGLGDTEQELAKRLINRAVLPQLDELQIYKADNFIGKQVTSVKVKPGKLDVSFW